MPTYGGGGAKCTICTKTVYPAETIQFEKKPYHVDCFKCTDCGKKMEGAAKASQFDDIIYCHNCFAKGGFAQKQKNVKWVKKESSGGSGIASKFGGGGNPCTVCSKTVYPAETVSFEKKVYHADCLACCDCSKKLKVSDCAQFDDKTYCLLCFERGGYRQKQAKWTPKGSGTTNSGIASKFGGGGNPCTVCTKTVYSAEAVSFEKKIYHAECLVCSIESCKKKCNVSSIAQFDDKLFCTKCFDSEGYRHKQAKVTKGTTGTTDSRFAKFGGGGAKCVRCTKTVYPAETVSFEKNVFHGDCFQCLNCNKKMTPSGAEGQKQPDGSVNVYCRKCWGELGMNRAQVKSTQ